MPLARLERAAVLLSLPELGPGLPLLLERLVAVVAHGHRPLALVAGQRRLLRDAPVAEQAPAPAAVRPAAGDRWLFKGA